MTEQLSDVAERAVLGAMLLRGSAVDEVATLLTHADFRNPNYGAVFAACVDVRGEYPGSVDLDWLMVADRADTTPKMGPDHLQRLADAAGTTANVRYYARQVIDAATLRRYEAAGHQIVTAVQAGRDVETVAQKALNALQAVQSARPAAGLQAKPFKELMAQQDAAYDWVVPQFLDRGDRFVLTGEEGLGKSFFLRQAALLTACGLSFVTFKPIPPKRVLVVDVENSEKQWRRNARSMWDTAREKGCDVGDRLHVACHGRIDVTRGDHLASLHRLIDQHQPDLFVIGPLYKITSKAIQSDDDAAPVIAALDSIRDKGITLMLETHMGHTKNALGSRDVRPRGSAALLGWPEFGAGLARAKSEASEGMPIPGLADLIHWRGQRDHRPWPDQWVHGATWPWEPL